MQDAIVDRAGKVRQGEEIDPRLVEPMLREALPDVDGALEIQQFRRGHSNLTYLVRFGGRELVLRRPPFGAKAIKAGHDMAREFRMLSHLRPVYAKVPEPLLFCEEERSPLGAPFYVMERVRGVILRPGPLPEGLEIDPPLMRRISEALVDELAALHSVDVEAAGMAELGRPEGYLHRQVSGWIERYRKAQTDDVVELEQVAGWLFDNVPGSTAAAVIHNDYKYDNLVLDPQDLGKVAAILDWEMSTIGDPLSDLGTTLAYWIDPEDPAEVAALPLGSTNLPGNLRRAEVVARYGERRGLAVPNMLFYYVNALFKIAVIAQQIYYRFHKGFTQDPRFAAFGAGVRIIAGQAARALDRSRIDNLS